MALFYDIKKLYVEKLYVEQQPCSCPSRSAHGFALAVYTAYDLQSVNNSKDDVCHFVNALRNKVTEMDRKMRSCPHAAYSQLPLVVQLNCKSCGNKVQLLYSNMKEKGVRQRTPLHRAVEENNLGAVGYCCLPSVGIDINCADDHGWTPLHIAADRGFHDIMRFLIARGADVNRGLWNKTTALHLAIWKSDAEAVTILLEAGADVTISVTSLKETPLHRACHHWYMTFCGTEKQPEAWKKPALAAIIKMLVDAGADMKTKNYQKLYPLQTCYDSEERERMIDEAGIRLLIDPQYC